MDWMEQASKIMVRWSSLSTEGCEVQFLLVEVGREFVLSVVPALQSDSGKQYRQRKLRQYDRRWILGWRSCFVVCEWRAQKDEHVGM
jgi:hypothetical protein